MTSRTSPVNCPALRAGCKRLAPRREVRDDASTASVAAALRGSVDCGRQRGRRLRQQQLDGRTRPEGPEPSATPRAASSAAMTGAFPRPARAAASGATCPPGCTTSLSGTVYDPAGRNPLYNVVVFVPNDPYGTLPPITPGTHSCNTCDVSIGNYVAATTTDSHGNFTLTGVPATSHVPLVVQTGKWRREVFLPHVAACTNTPVAAANSRLPKNHTEGDLPQMAPSHGRLRRPRLLHEEHGDRRRRVHGPSRRRAPRRLPGRRHRRGSDRGKALHRRSRQLHGPAAARSGPAASRSSTTTS